MDRVAPDANAIMPRKDVQDLNNIQEVLASFPAHPAGKHWRELREVKKINGDCSCIL
jgi:hypothetical protein